MKITFRKAIKADVPLILRFISELAEYEDLGHEVITTEDILRKSLFGDRVFAEVIFAVIKKKEIGFVLFFHNFSTFIGKPGIYIEDLYIMPEYRNIGIGKSLFKYMGNIAQERECERLEWWVLKWNPARKFYESLGARAMEEWIVYRLDGEPLKGLSVDDPSLNINHT